MKKLVSQARLKQHSYNVHGPGSILISCPIPGCNKQVKQYTLNDHKRYSHGPNIECTKCGKKFTKHVMYKHQRIAHGLKFRYREPTKTTENPSPLQHSYTVIDALENDATSTPRHLLLLVLERYQKPAILDPVYEPGTDENDDMIKTLCEIAND